MILDDATGIFFHRSADITRKQLVSVRQYRCGCPPAPGGVPCAETFLDLESLMKHTSTGHQMHVCDLCARHRAVFVMEVPRMSAKKLQQHYTQGDPAMGFGGHPLCKFCDTRYYDDSALWMHMNRDHFHCHICARVEAPGTRQYYSEYHDLEKHFKKHHFVCEDPACQEVKFQAFESTVDLTAHMSEVHGHHGDITPQLSFRYAAPRQDDRRWQQAGGRGGRRGGSGRAGDDRAGGDDDGSDTSDAGSVHFEDDGSRRVRHITMTAQDFPSLRLASANMPTAAPSAPSGGRGAAAPASTGVGAGAPAASGRAGFARAASGVNAPGNAVDNAASFPALPTASAAAGGASAGRPGTMASRASAYRPGGSGRVHLNAYTSLDSLLAMTGQGHLYAGGSGQGTPTAAADPSGGVTTFINGVPVTYVPTSGSGKAAKGKSSGATGAGKGAGREEAEPSYTSSPGAAGTNFQEEPPSSTAWPSHMQVGPTGSRQMAAIGGASAGTGAGGGSDSPVQSTPLRSQAAAYAPAPAAPPAAQPAAAPVTTAQASGALRSSLSLLPDGFTRFKECSTRYRQGSMPAHEYHAACVDLFAKAETLFAQDPVAAAAAPSSSPMSVFRVNFPALLAGLPDPTLRGLVQGLHGEWEAAQRQAEMESSNRAKAAAAAANEKQRKQQQQTAAAAERERERLEREAADAAMASAVAAAEQQQQQARQAAPAASSWTTVANSAQAHRAPSHSLAAHIAPATTTVTAATSPGDFPTLVAPAQPKSAAKGSWKAGSSAAAAHDAAAYPLPSQAGAGRSMPSRPPSLAAALSKMPVAPTGKTVLPAAAAAMSTSATDESDFPSLSGVPVSASLSDLLRGAGTGGKRDDAAAGPGPLLATGGARVAGGGGGKKKAAQVVDDDEDVFRVVVEKKKVDKAREREAADAALAAQLQQEEEAAAAAATDRPAAKYGKRGGPLGFVPPPTSAALFGNDAEDEYGGGGGRKKDKKAKKGKGDAADEDGRAAVDLVESYYAPTPATSVPVSSASQYKPIPARAAPAAPAAPSPVVFSDAEVFPTLQTIKLTSDGSRKGPLGFGRRIKAQAGPVYRSAADLNRLLSGVVDHQSGLGAGQVDDDREVLTGGARNYAGHHGHQVVGGKVAKDEVDDDLAAMMAGVKVKGKKKGNDYVSGDGTN